IVYPPRRSTFLVVAGSHVAITVTSCPARTRAFASRSTRGSCVKALWSNITTRAIALPAHRRDEAAVQPEQAVALVLPVQLLCGLERVVPHPREVVGPGEQVVHGAR